MIETIRYPEKNIWPEILARPDAADDAARKVFVAAIMKDVKERGDKALQYYDAQFGNAATAGGKVTTAEIQAATNAINAQLKQAIDQAFSNIKAFHTAQAADNTYTETMPGITCWRKAVAIETVGLYIPGGTAPLFSTLLMLAIPATVAGCKNIIVCTPPGPGGDIHPAILYTAYRCGVTHIYKTGGAQAIAAMAYGTETIPKVYKIFGPGNSYVTTAKMLAAAEGIAIDMPAGPSELAILADESSVPEYIAADLLSQAEHGVDSQVLLVCSSETVIIRTQHLLLQAIEKLPRKHIALQALQHSKAILVNSIKEGMNMINTYAPEHLIICCEQAEEIAALVINAGSVFIGNYAPESVGDYASGTNHVLPTSGYARSYSGVATDSFVKKISFQQLTQQGLKNIADTVCTMAMAEGLEAHAKAVTIRFSNNYENI